MTKDIILLTAHYANTDLIEKYFKLRFAFNKYGDVILLLHKETNEEFNIPSEVTCAYFSVEILNSMEFQPIEETFIPGSNHFSLLWFYKNHPEYRYYWNIEYDVEFSGNWGEFFDSINKIEADFVSSKIYRYTDNKNWFWWESYQGSTLDIPLEKRISSFNPIYRIKNNALEFLISFLKEGNKGHHEVLIPSVLYFRGYQLADFGGNGDFVPEGYKDKFYLSFSSKSEHTEETMRYRPLFTPEKVTAFPNKLFHPVKPNLAIGENMTRNTFKNSDDSFFLLNKKMLSSIDKTFLGLANGKMGLCIYFFHLARLKAQPEYENIAEELLEEIVNNISLETSINVEVGLAGIAIGIRHLIKEQYIRGDSNEILDEIDNEIYKKIVFEGGDDSTVFLPEMIHILFYLHACYSEQTKESQKYIYSELIVKTIEIVYQRLASGFWDEPLSFTINYHLPRFLFVISKIISLNIYNNRIFRILDEFKAKFLGALPCSHGNRLFLLWGLVHLNNAHQNPDFQNQINILKTHIDLSRILNIELSENQIFLHNGVSLVCFLLLNLRKTNLANSIEFDSSVLYNRIINATVWNTLKFEEYHYGLLNGIPGSIWALYLLKK